MGKRSKPEGRYIGTLVSLEEYEKFKQLYAASMDLTMADFIRKKVFGKPVRVFYRDKAYDEFTEAAVLLKKTLTAHTMQGYDGAYQLWLKTEIATIKELLIKIETHARNNKKQKKGS